MNLIWWMNLMNWFLNGRRMAVSGGERRRGSSVHVGAILFRLKTPPRRATENQKPNQNQIFPWIHFPLFEKSFHQWNQDKWRRAAAICCQLICTCKIFQSRQRCTNGAGCRRCLNLPPNVAMLPCRVIRSQHPFYEIEIAPISPCLVSFQLNSSFMFVFLKHFCIFASTARAGTGNGRRRRRRMLPTTPTTLTTPSRNRANRALRGRWGATPRGGRLNRRRRRWRRRRRPRRRTWRRRRPWRRRGAARCSSRDSTAAVSPASTSPAPGKARARSRRIRRRWRPFFYSNWFNHPTISIHSFITRYKKLKKSFHFVN